MSDKKVVPTVRLVAPNGVRVSVAESKSERLLAAGYSRPKSTGATARRKKADQADDE